MGSGLAVVSPEADRDTMTVDVQLVETVITTGDLSALTPEQRVRYYIETCNDLGLNWRTKPFDVVRLRKDGPQVLYPNKGCAEQLSRKYGVSTESVKSEELRGVYVEWVRACTRDGRCVTKKGAVPVANLSGDALANALMKTETKGFRRAVLALIGLNMTDESELDTIPGARVGSIDVETGEIHLAPLPPPPLPPTPQPRTVVNGQPVGKRPTLADRLRQLFGALECNDEDQHSFFKAHFDKGALAELTVDEGKSAIGFLEREIARRALETAPTLDAESNHLPPQSAG